ncbi:hypothetical protein DZ08F97_46830 [Escherichia coli]|nr:hypothetical protein ECZU06_43950 [Escherichia coli]GHK72340.1 hypothetical protein ECZU12_37510 [Escherichia coli]GHK85030.1 hypothetical protein ECZU17_09670 [Escherichia coli]GHL22169.1 hypothetical protein ECZU24_50100 [Escherichia coli]GHL26566.1 hypothetical protein ECZU25_33790 [Escherichia coli]
MVNDTYRIWNISEVNETFDFPADTLQIIAHFHIPGYLTVGVKHDLVNTQVP